MAITTMYNVFAVVAGKPLAKQNDYPMTKEKATALATRLEKGQTQAARVLVCKFKGAK